MNRRKLILTGAAACLALPAHTQEARDENCVPFDISEAYAAARASWPLVLHNGFNAVGQGLAGLEVEVALDTPPTFSLGNCTPPDVLTDLKCGPDGQTSGIVLATNRSLSGGVFGQRLFFTVETLRDWRWVPEGTSKAYGDYTSRAALRFAVDGRAIRLRLHPDPIPPGWT